MGKRAKNNSGPVQLNDGAYDFLNGLVTLVLPGLGTLYFTIAKIWGLPYAEEVVGTLAAVAVFAGILVKLSKIGYKGDGVLVVQPNEYGQTTVRIEGDIQPEDLAGKKTVQYEVVTKANPIPLA